MKEDLVQSGHVGVTLVTSCRSRLRLGRYVVLSLTLLLLGVPRASLSAGLDVSVCAEPIRYASKVVAKTANAEQQAAIFYHNVCKASEEQEAKGFDAGGFIDVIVPAKVPTPLQGKWKVGYSNDKEKRKQFCEENKTYEAKYGEASSLAEKAVPEAYDSFKRCVEMLKSDLQSQFPYFG